MQQLTKAVTVAFAMLMLAECTDTSDLQTQSLAYQKAYCASKGKQFLWQDTKTEHGIVARSVTAQGRCVGPGDRGYQPPSVDAEH